MSYPNQCQCGKPTHGHRQCAICSRKNSKNAEPIDEDPEKEIPCKLQSGEPVTIKWCRTVPVQDGCLGCLELAKKERKNEDLQKHKSTNR